MVNRQSDDAPGEDISLDADADRPEYANGAHFAAAVSALAEQSGDDADVNVDVETFGPSHPADPLTIVNPTLEVLSPSKKNFAYESCLSIDGYFGVVERFNKVRVTGHAIDGTAVDWVADGWAARVLQASLRAQRVALRV